MGQNRSGREPDVRTLQSRSVPGADYVLGEALRHGFRPDDPAWCNLGQGQPEVGPLPNSPAASVTLSFEEADYRYGPVSGLEAMRQAVSDHYNRLYRFDRKSKYSARNVAICGGGRIALSRALAALGSARIGYRTPDYMAFGELIAQNMPRLEPIRLDVGGDCLFKLSAPLLRRAIEKDQLGAFLFSNPCNPTGQLTDGEELQSIVEAARSLECTLVTDEFYSHYVYGSEGLEAAPVSAARHVEDVDSDPILIVDGITKNLRRPGWRLAWTVGPAGLIERIAHVGTALDGGPSTLAQRAAMSLLCPSFVDRETAAIRQAFARKRDLMLDGLRHAGIRVPAEPRGTFYVWGEVSELPQALNDGERFFQAALKERIVVVPGLFFDVNPCQHRGRDIAYRDWVRFSFGPDEQCLRPGLDRLAGLVAAFS